MKKKWLIALICSSATAAIAGDNGKTINFDDADGKAVLDLFDSLRTGGGANGKWIVRAAKDAPSAPNVLAQVDTDDTDDRYAVALFKAPSLKDLRVSVKCNAISGKVDQVCGLVLRGKDANNYYVTRSNVLENNIRFYYVKDGKRRQLSSWGGKVTPGWHELAIEARGDRFQVFWDGKAVLDTKDTTFTEAGRVGLWTKADSVTEHDDLRIQAL